MSSSINFTPQMPTPATSSWGSPVSIATGGIAVATTGVIAFTVMLPTFSDVKVINIPDEYISQATTVSAKINGSTNLISNLYVSNDNGKVFKPFSVNENEALFSLTENGNYTFYLTDKANNVDTAEIYINFIDNKAPTIDDYFMQEDILTITINDDLSGVNFSSKSIYGIDLDEKKIFPLEIDTQNNIVKFHLSKTHKDFKLHIEDVTGNLSKHTVTIIK